VTKDNLYTPAEQAILGKKVVAIVLLEYPMFTIKPGQIGVIYDFGKTSGDPFVDWGGNKGIAVLKRQIVLLEVTA